MKPSATLLLLFWLSLPAHLPGQQLLERYLAIAAEHHPGLQAAFAEYEAAMQEAARVGGLPQPELSVAIAALPTETRAGPQAAQLSLSQRFPWFGTLKAERSVAATRAEAAYQRFLDERAVVFREVRQAYGRLWETKRLLALEEENAGLLKEDKRLAESRQRSGGSLADIYRAERAIDASQTERDLLADELRTRRRQFNHLLNRPAADSVAVADSLPLPGPKVLETKDSLPGHPRVQHHRKLARSAGRAGELARLQGLPSFEAGLRYGAVRPRQDVADVPDNGDDMLMPAFSIRIPLWRKQYRAARKQAQLRQQAHQLRAGDEANRLASTWEQVRYDHRRAIEERRLAQRQAALTRKTLALAITDYRAGREDFVEVLRLRRQWVADRSAWVQATARAFRQHAAMLYLLTPPSTKQ